MPHRGLDLMPVGAALALKVFGDPGVKAGVGEGMRAMNGDGEKAPLDLMRPLRACLDALKIMRDGVFDEPIIAELKMKVRELFARTPITSVEVLPFFEADSGGDDLALMTRDAEQDAMAQPLISELKEARL